MKIVTAIQVRMSSSRLPCKVLLPLAGEPLLFRMIERVDRSKLKGIVVVATTIMPEDDIIEQLCIAKGIKCFRGNKYDLLDRHYQLALEYKADAIVKIPSDCPLIDPIIIDQVIRFFLEHFPDFDYVSNLHPASYPDGNDVEIMSVSALETAWMHAQKDYEREHTTPYIWENPSTFNIGNVCWSTANDLSMIYRWTIDYIEDYQFIYEIYNRLFQENPCFGLDDILSLIREHPEISILNKHHAGHYWYDNHLDELNTIIDYKNKVKRHEN
jgi:spore coat polysaccharide biosynthesis protein SpsF